MKAMIPTVTPVKKGLSPRLRTSVLIDAGNSSGTGGIATGSGWYASDRCGMEPEDMTASENIQRGRQCNLLLYHFGCSLDTSPPKKRVRRDVGIRAEHAA